MQKFYVKPQHRVARATYAASSISANAKKLSLTTPPTRLLPTSDRKSETSSIPSMNITLTGVTTNTNATATADSATARRQQMERPNIMTKDTDITNESSKNILNDDNEDIEMSQEETTAMANRFGLRNKNDSLPGTQTIRGEDVLSKGTTNRMMMTSQLDLDNDNNDNNDNNNNNKSNANDNNLNDLQNANDDDDNHSDDQND